MKRTLVDYRGFSLRRLNEPRFSHLKLLGGWLVYFALYFLTENLIPVERCHPIHCALDDRIPFVEYFAVFYVGWYAFVFGALLYYLLVDVESFRGLSKFILVTQLVAMICYILFPSRQDLRPESFTRDNLFTQTMAFIYSFDTSTGVCPSLHAAYSFGVCSTVLKDRLVSQAGKWGVCLFTLMVCLAVCFVKQHSALDVAAAIPLGLLAETIAYGKSWWLPRLQRRA
ncbi:MAG: phosphatidic acid phosphatase [Oscillospiraceae bacterium]|nr:phosphatidic acid phosphatase [Oscillospiraceae bacterium]